MLANIEGRWCIDPYHMLTYVVLVLKEAKLFIIPSKGPLSEKSHGSYNYLLIECFAIDRKLKTLYIASMVSIDHKHNHVSFDLLHITLDIIDFVAYSTIDMP